MLKKKKKLPHWQGAESCAAHRHFRMSQSPNFLPRGLSGRLCGCCTYTAAAWEGAAMACGCCEHRRAALLCPGCFAASCAGCRGDAQALAAQRNAAERQLAVLVADKVGLPAP